MAASTASRVVLDPEVDDAVGVLDVDRAYCLGLVYAQPATLDHRRPAHPDGRVLGGDHHVAAAEQRRVAGEAETGGDPYEWHEAAEAGEQVKRAAVEPGDVRPVDITRAPAAALGEQHDGEAAVLGDLEQAVLLEVVSHPLGAGEHRVVVGHGDRGMAVDLADAGHQAVRRGAPDQLVLVAAGLLGGEDQRAVLDEGAGVEEVLEVLAGRAAVLVVALLGRLGAGGRPG